ncbi:MAG: type 1 glutamine amidotransferase-like domain-containing protein [bacterium]|nr:type 1 glutamine amidotransferase-like domain-containing protein [bacterium]
MDTTVKPVFLLADSNLLFWKDDEGSFVERIHSLVLEDRESEEPIKAAYIGASNGDNPDFYDIFIAAMQQVEITDCRMIPSEPTDEDIAFLENADFILLAGGDTEMGWKVIEDKFQKIIVERYYKGTVLMGVSAGAVQLGLKGWKEPRLDTLFDTFQLVPAVIDVHDEESDWDGLKATVEKLGGYTRGFGVPSGGAAVYHPDWSFEAVRHHLVEFSHVEKELKRSLILPSDKSSAIRGPEKVDDDSERKVISPDDILNSGIDLPPGIIDAQAEVVE